MDSALDQARAALLRLDPALAGAEWQALAGGRTNRLWRVGDLAVKCHAADAASPLFPNDPLAEARALTLLAPLGLAPRLVAAGADWLIYRHLPGGPWRGDPAPVARMLHRLHRTAVPPDSFRPAPNGSAALLAHARAILPPPAALPTAGLPEAPPDPGLPPVPPVPIHADAVIGNVIAAPDGPVLIDWQCPAMGDPAEDICTFLSPAMLWLYGGLRPDPSWHEAFLQAYPDPATTARARALMPLYRWRMAAHCAWKAARGDADYASALRLELA